MNVITSYRNKEKNHQPISSRKKKILFMLTSIFVLMLGVTLVTIHLQHENIWASYKQAITEKEKSQAAMLELTKELDTLIVDEKTCLSNVNDSTFCSAAIELSQKAHETGKKIERTEKIAQPKAWIYSVNLLEKIRTATKQAQADEKEYILLNKDLKKQIEKLEAAYLDKALNDYASLHSTLQSKIETLQALIDSTQGKVTDDTVRQDTQTTIKNAQEILNTDVDEKNLEELRTATSKLMEQQTVLGEKSKAIIESRDEWHAEQDRVAKQAAAAEAEAKRQAQAAARSYNNGSTYNNRNNSTGNNSTGVSEAWNYSQGNYDDSPITWDNESNRTDLDYKLPEGFIPYG